MTTFIALKTPGAADAVADPNNIIGKFGNLGGILGGTTTNYGLYDIILWVSMVLMLFWMIWGVFQYLFAGGNKEGLAKARSRITWAIVGFVIIIMAYTIQKYVKEIFPPNPATPVTPVSIPLRNGAGGGGSW